MHLRYTEREREGAHDPCDTKADISSLITLRNGCNESEWVSETEKCKGNGGELSERERKKERSESELIKMSAEVWKEKGGEGRISFSVRRRGRIDDAGVTLSCLYVTYKQYTTFTIWERAHRLYVLEEEKKKDYTSTKLDISPHHKHITRTQVTDSV